MTTARSPKRVLRAQAFHMAALLKRIEAGENPTDDVGGKLAAARTRPSVKFAIAMDDQTLIIDMPWAQIRDTRQAGIAEFILQQMRGHRETTH